MRLRWRSADHPGLFYPHLGVSPRIASSISGVPSACHGRAFSGRSIRDPSNVRAWSEHCGLDDLARSPALLIDLRETICGPVLSVLSAFLFAAELLAVHEIAVRDQPRTLHEM